VVERDLGLDVAQVEIVEIDEVAELDGDALGAGEPWLVEGKLQLAIKLEVPVEEGVPRGEVDDGELPGGEEHSGEGRVPPVDHQAGCTG